MSTARVQPEIVAQTWLGTDTDLLEPPALDFDSRIGRCYELATHAVVFGTAPSYARLVHGSWHGPGAPQRIGHAWVEWTENGRALVWEPIRGRVYDRDAFYHWADARAERTYLKNRALRNVAVRGNYGPWYDTSHLPKKKVG